MQAQLRNVKQVRASERAFAAILESEAVGTWSDSDYGGRLRSQVQEQRRNVKQNQAAGRAFAAIVESGAVATWSNPDSGGDSSQVQDLLNVQQSQATARGGFAATLESVVATCGARLRRR